ncbi:DUF4097 domain-containing protein [Peptostreptococcaceae bacterium OttesenSCG-928-C18]|nr:DUF4097 domain-containing protein [Peptostreptococcaceae bacterium OttesenSCG-928-C18]
MKSKKALIISSIFIVIGLIICVIAFSISGLSSFSFDSRFGNVLFNNNGANVNSYIGKGGNTITQSEIKELDSFNRLNINLNYANLNIKKSEDEKFKLEVIYKNDNSKIKYEIKNNTLSVEDIYNHKVKHNNRNEITIYLPTNVELEHFNSYCDLGETKIDSLNAKNIKIENNMGSIKITNSKFTNSEIDLDIGEFIGENIIFTNINLESNMGSVTIDGQILGQNELSMDMGALNLKLNQSKEDTKLVAESDLGAITIDGVTSSGISSEQIINPSGTNSIELEANMGSIDISFK